jgi:neutral trehalase
VTYLPELEAEHEYWMDGSTVLRGGQGYRRVVRLSDGTILNRYWDDRAEPRDESYREDIATEVQTVRRKLLMTGGVATTLVVSGQPRCSGSQSSVLKTTTKRNWPQQSPSAGAARL